MFVALSAFAVPACQHYEAGGKPDREQAMHRRSSPAPVVDVPRPQPA